ncbi:MAG: hypothetical protein ABW166_12085 [Sedimenticola sp.]
MDLFVTFDTLKEITGYKTSTAVEQCLKKQGIPILYGKNGPFTTVTAFENALGLRVESSKPNPEHSFDF